MNLERPETLRYDMSKRLLNHRVKRPRKTHHASDAEDCLRRLFYTWKGYPGDNPNLNRTNMSMEMGKAAEEFGRLLMTAQSGAEDCGCSFDGQVDLGCPIGEYTLHGIADFVFHFCDDDWRRYFPQYARSSDVPFEVKSVGTKKYEEVTLRGPIDSHIGQLNAYTCLLGSSLGILLYVQREAKEDVPFNLWLVPQDQLRFDNTVDRLRRLETYLELDQPPLPVCEPGKLDPYCPFIKRCEADGLGNRACLICGRSINDNHETCKRWWK